jgi:hypothetical protein
MMLHIFRKDVRRLWPAIALSVVTLGSLAWHDRWRSDWLPGATEGYLNLLVPLVSALLLGLAVEQEPIAGDRQFWLTRPYSRTALLGAKLLFAAAFVHLPWLIADCWIMAARGFAPAEYVVELLRRQVVLAGALTLPAMALASLVRSFAHFVMESVGVATALLLLSGSIGERQFHVYWEPFTTVRREAVILVVAGACVSILVLQYLGRRVVPSRALGAAAAAGAALLYTFFMPHTALAVRVATRAASAAPSLRLDPAGPKYPHPVGDRDVVVALPILVDGFPEGAAVRLDPVRSEIETAGGRRYADEMATSLRRHMSMPYRVGMVGSQWDERHAKWMHLSIDPRTWADLQAGPVTLRGEIAATLLRIRESAWLGMEEQRFVAGAGHCYTSVVADRYAERIKLECESPGRQVGARVRLWSPDVRRDWKGGLAIRAQLNMPGLISLSPLTRIQSTWDLAPEPIDPRDTWRVPASAAPGVKMEVTPVEIVGYAAVRYEFRDVDLRRYRVRSFSFPGGR